MKPAPFDYQKPATIPEALELLAAHGGDAAVLAGGQSLVATLNLRLSAPAVVVDVNGIESLKGISETGGKLRIGALSRHAEIAISDLVARHAPLIAAAMPHIAHPAIRNRGTIGGSIALADPASELPACLLALGGAVEITGADGARLVAAEDFFQALYETALAPGELITAVEIPVLAPGYRSAIDEFARRHGDYAMAGLAAHAHIEDGTFSDARLVFFAVGGTPVKADAAARAIDGKALDDATLADVRAALDDDLDPFDEIGASAAMKMHLARVLTGQVLAAVAE